MKLITKQYHDQLITFDLTSDCLINLTEMAKANDKEVKRWLELDTTKSYLEKLAQRTEKATFELLIVKSGNGGGTWATKQVAIRFAQWLSDDFAIWVDAQIDELLTNGVVAMPTSYRDAIAQLLIEIDAKEEAQRTKAEIGSRREATAMQTASAATRRVNNLEIELDKNHHWATILKVQQVTGIKYDWVALKDYMTAHGIPIKKIDSGVTRFAVVNSYHADAWHNVYNVDITEFRTC